MPHSASDEIWQEMQLSNKVSNQSHEKAKRALLRLESRCGCASPDKNAPTPQSLDKATYLVCLNSVTWNLSRELNLLSDARVSIRKKAALVLQNYYLDTPTETRSKESLKSDFRVMAKPLFKRFNDPVEQIRQISIQLVAFFITQEEDMMLHLPYLIPAIARSLGSVYQYDEEEKIFTREASLLEAFKRGRVYTTKSCKANLIVQEASEEIRLLFFDLLGTIFQRMFALNSASMLHAYVFDMLLLLAGGVNDSYHEINVVCCRTLIHISNEMVSVMKHFTVAFVRALRPLLLSRLSRVRVTAIDCIRAMITCPDMTKSRGSGTEAIADLIGHREENVIPISAFYAPEVRVNFFAKLDQDGNVMVRQHFFEMVIDFMWSLPDRYDFEGQLMPYLLSAASDDNNVIVRNAIAAIERMGKRYADEQGEEVLDMKQYGLMSANSAYNYDAPLPPPFTDMPPSLEAKLFIRTRVRRFINTVLKELQNWQCSVKKHAAMLLKTIIVYSEESITIDSHTIIHHLMVMWEDTDIHADLRDIAELLGRFCLPETYTAILLSRIRSNSKFTVCLTSDMIYQACDILKCFMHGSLKQQLLPHVEEIADIVLSPEVLHMENFRVKSGVLEIFAALCQIMKDAGLDRISSHFLRIARLSSMELLFRRLVFISLHFNCQGDFGNEPNDSYTERSLYMALDSLADAAGRNSFQKLYEEYFIPIWEDLMIELGIKCSDGKSHLAAFDTNYYISVLSNLLRHAFAHTSSIDDAKLQILQDSCDALEKLKLEVDSSEASGRNGLIDARERLHSLIAQIQIIQQLET